MRHCRKIWKWLFLYHDEHDKLTCKSLQLFYRNFLR